MRTPIFSLLLISLSMVAGTSSIADPLQAIGRFETITSKCKYRLGSGSLQTCHVVQMDRKTATVTGVRFIGRGVVHGSSRHLTFVANAPDQTIPLRCISGSCTLKGKRWTATVSSVAESKFDGRGVAEGLPQAWPVNGVCELSLKKLRCKARAMSGEILTGEAQL
ncbi:MULTISPECIES: hypothetical protein [unclassified Prochlorococcus]|uniref:hypothetical protein n=1 Tax=unclassified Prochlorococcus TaxID=2627481 RepID=UPI00055A318A|nr:MULTISPECIES: hypothetical protein [unclassified Prochlorococcus]